MNNYVNNYQDSLPSINETFFGDALYKAKEVSKHLFKIKENYSNINLIMHVSQVKDIRFAIKNQKMKNFILLRPNNKSYDSKMLIQLYLPQEIAIKYEILKSNKSPKDLYTINSSDVINLSTSILSKLSMQALQFKSGLNLNGIGSTSPNYTLE